MLSIKCFHVKLLSLLISALLLVSCQTERGENELILGSIAGPETTLMRTAIEVAATRYNLTIKLVEFEDYTLPNTALAEGAIDANVFQHEAYLSLVRHYRNNPIESIGQTFIYPMGIYSLKLTDLAQIPIGATVAIPNDPSNSARALRLLAKAKLINIPDENDMQLNVKSIYNNPYQLTFKELEAAQLPRILSDVELAVINTNFALPAGLMPHQDALAVETKTSRYANVVVVRAAEKGAPKYQKLLAALQSPEVLAKAQQVFHEQAIPAWSVTTEPPP
jgi:D-methionine transport system substrate-binding protein